MPKIYCRKCGDTVQAKDLYCQKCGSSLDANTVTEERTHKNQLNCPDCGGFISDKDVFCTNCGMSLEEPNVQEFRILDSLTPKRGFWIASMFIILSILFLAIGLYYLVLDVKQVNVNPTQMTSTVQSISQNDAGTGSDSVCDYNNPVMIGHGEFSGSLPLGDEADCFDFRYTMGDLLEITVTVDAELVIAPPELYPGAGSQPFQKTNESVYTVKYTVGRADYYLEGNENEDRTIGFSIYKRGGNGNYTLRISESTQNDAASGMDASGGTPVGLAQPGMYTGFVGYADECDTYTYSPLKAGNILTVTANPDPGLDVSLSWITVREIGGANPDLRYYDPNFVIDVNEQGLGGIENMIIPFLADESTAFYYQAGGGEHTSERFSVCYQEGIAGQYTLNVSVK